MVDFTRLWMGGNITLTKVERGWVSGSNRPSDGNWAGRVDLSRRLIEL
jgi:hypothetical protein